MTSFREQTLDAYATDLAAATPVPGGGSASAIAAALGASLVTMVARLSTGRPAFADHEPLLAWAIDRGEVLRQRFLELADRDGAAFATFAAALKLPRETDDQIAARSAAVRAAARVATDVPFACVEACLELVGVAEALAGRSNRNAASDLGVGAYLADAAAHGAAANVLINLLSVADPAYEGEMTTRVHGLVNDIERLARSVHEAVGRGEPRDPLPAVRR
jgi:glutamate formiminotransferase/formiminotetrahydrofolate cyclodeaminase